MKLFWKVKKVTTKKALFDGLILAINFMSEQTFFEKIFAIKCSLLQRNIFSFLPFTNPRFQLSKFTSRIVVVVSWAAAAAPSPTHSQNGQILRNPAIFSGQSRNFLKLWNEIRVSSSRCRFQNSNFAEFEVEFGHMCDQLILEEPPTKAPRLAASRLIRDYSNRSSFYKFANCKTFLADVKVNWTWKMQLQIKVQIWSIEHANNDSCLQIKV